MKLYRILLFTFLITEMFFSQVSLNLKSGVGYVSDDITSKGLYSDDFRSKASFFLSLGLGKDIGKNFSFSQEFTFSKREFGFSESYYNREENLLYNYLLLSSHLKYKIPAEKLIPFIYVGPSITVFLSGRDIIKSQSTIYPYINSTREINLSKSMNKFGLGLSVGSGIEYLIDKNVGITLNLDYYFDLTDYLESEELSDYFKVLSFQIGISYKLE